MDKLRALQYLVKVADTLSFSRAAKAFGDAAHANAARAVRRSPAQACGAVRGER